MVENVWGPVNGFWVAAYAAPTGEGDRFCSYAKVCWERPASYWDADCAFKVFGGEHHRSAEEAMHAVVADARSEIQGLPRHARQSRSSLGRRCRRFARRTGGDDYDRHQSSRFQVWVEALPLLAMLCIDGAFSITVRQL